MTLTFFKDEGKHNDVSIDIHTFGKLLSEYANSFDEAKQIIKMKEILRDKILLQDFLQRLNVNLRYLVELTYAYSPKIITPQLAKELGRNVMENPKYPYD